MKLEMKQMMQMDGFGFRPGQRVVWFKCDKNKRKQEATEQVYGEIVRVNTMMLRIKTDDGRMVSASKENVQAMR